MPLLRRAVRRFASRLISISMFLRWPRLTAVILALSAVSENQKGEYNVLCLGRSVFMEDIRALADQSHKIRYIHFPLSYLVQVFFSFFRPDQVTEADYHINTRCGMEKAAYHSFISRMIPVLKRILGFDAVLSCNFGYLPQQEFADICLKNRIPFIVLYKEAVIVSFRLLRYYKRVYRHHRFIGSRFLLYTEQIKDALVRTKISGLTDDKMTVVGVPRLDAYVRYVEPVPSSCDQVAFFSFFIKDKLRHRLDDAVKAGRAERRAEEFHRMVMEFALRNRNIRVVVKTKMAEHYVRYVADIREKYFSGRNIPNLEITNSPPAFDLIKESGCVIGFSSTTLLEGILANRLVVAPFFRDILPQGPWDYFENFPRLARYARTVKDLEEFILHKEKHINRDSGLRRKFLEYFVYKPDGKAGLRTEKAVLREIERFGKERG